MLALSFTFPAGRYHATPWDRHVNEGAVAWPPEPWRILRALIATWHHKIKHNSKHDEHILLALIESLAVAPPQYTLPDASHSHTRHYMPQFAVGDTSLVFDAFCAVDRTQPLVVAWPDLNLPDDQSELLDDLLAVQSYLGRADSWVEAQRTTELPEPNCQPGTNTLDTSTGELFGEIITLYAPLSAGEYATLRQGFLADKKAKKKIERTLPSNLLDALSVDTAALRKRGWNRPPAARLVSYVRLVDALKPVRRIQSPDTGSVTTVSFLLVGKPLPRVEDSLRIGELMRMAVMSQAKQIFGEHDIPPVFSGHNLPAGNRHHHAFYLPWDSNGDGRIDRILVHVPAGLDGPQRKVLQHVSRLWSRSGSQWRLIQENQGGTDIGGRLTQPATCWASVTPYLHPWHAKKHFTIGDQIRRECQARGLPELKALEFLDTIEVGHHQRRAIHFHRFRSRRGLSQPDRNGSFWRLTFVTPIEGPMGLGFACHFGLGLFQPVTS